jgi:hypothetical protein
MHCCLMIRRMVHIVYHRVEWELLLKTMWYPTSRIALVISTLNTKLASPVSRRDALYAELASLARKSISTPARLVDRGNDRREHSSNRELPPHPCAL